MRQRQRTMEAARTQALADAVFKLEAIRDWAETTKAARLSGAVMGNRGDTGYLAAAAEVLRILDET